MTTPQHQQLTLEEQLLKRAKLPAPCLIAHGTPFYLAARALERAGRVTLSSVPADFGVGPLVYEVTVAR